MSPNRFSASVGLRACILALALVVAAACDEGRPPETPSYEGTVGDAVIEFVDTIGAMADILADIDDLEDCKQAKEPLALRVSRLRETHAVIGDLSPQAWAQMPRSIDERRQEAIRRFNAEAVRVMIERERGLLLRDVIIDVPTLIYPKAAK